MSYSLIAHTFAGSTNGGAVTTPAIDTTGASLLVAYVSSDTGSSNGVSDSKGNTYLPLTIYGASFSNPANARLYYCLNPVVGTNHTFTYGTNGFPALFVEAFGGAGSYESQNGSTTQSSPGSVTPINDGSLLVTGVASQWQPAAIDSGFTITDTIQIAGGAHYAGGLAYLIQSTKASVNPTWSFGGQSTPVGSSIAVFAPPVSAQQQPIIQVMM